MTITCLTCSRSFASYRGMNGHRRVCSLQSRTKKKGTKRKVEYATTEFDPLQQRHCASDSEDTLGSQTIKSTMKLITVIPQSADC